MLIFYYIGAFLSRFVFDWLEAKRICPCSLSVWAYSQQSREKPSSAFWSVNCSIEYCDERRVHSFLPSVGKIVQWFCIKIIVVYWRRRRDLPLRGMLTFNNDRLLEFEKKQKRFRAAALGIIITSLAKRGMVNATSMNWAGLFSGMTSGDKTFLFCVVLPPHSYPLRWVFP